MKYLILSDLHSNTEALEAVLGDARRRGFDRVACMGDLVGYGAEPNAVVERVRGLDHAAVIRGNHDKVAGGLESGDQFNFVAGLAARWTQSALGSDNLSYLRSLPRGPLVVDGAFWLAHGTPLDEDAYILNDFDALEAFNGFPEDLCFFGHSHIPTIFSLSDDEGLVLQAPVADEARLALKPGVRYLINPGSVGQPRDRNPKAAYAVYDAATRMLDLYRVGYDIEAAQRKILAANLPHFLADRLRLGA